MVLPLIGKLAGSALRAAARNLFPGFYERGISANQALRELQGQGLGYRRTDFLADFRQGLGTYTQATKVRFVSADKVPSEGILESLYHGVPDKYSLVFKATGTDSVTGEERDQYFFYHRNSLDTRANMESDARSWLESQADKYGYLTESVSLTEGYINPIWE
jgi:hypothetical protein